MSACAVFDLDGTIIDSSSERLFFFYLLKRGKLRLGSLAEWLIDWIRLLIFKKVRPTRFT
jgi:FMN phosphatase YigB (HAD superfamily)